MMAKVSLGIDPGIWNTGWSVVRRMPSGYMLVDSGTIRTPSKTPIGKRLEVHYNTVRELITEHEPDLVSIEGVFFGRNISSCLSTASVIAVIELAAQQAGIKAVQVKPQAVKAAVTGKGTASKEQVIKMVNKLLGVDILNQHEADAIAAGFAGLLVRE